MGSIDILGLDLRLNANELAWIPIGPSPIVIISADLGEDTIPRDQRWKCDLGRKDMYYDYPKGYE